MVIDCFDEFINKNMMNYSDVKHLPIHFTGSISYHFKEQLTVSLQKNNLKMGNVLKQPMEGLIKYFKQQQNL